MKSELLPVITHQEKRLSLPTKYLFVEAHRDDTAMGANLSQHADLTIVTLTDGAARKHARYTQEEMRLQRRVEGVHAAKLEGATDIFFADFPDGDLTNYIVEASNSLRAIIAEKQPDFLIATSRYDAHPDHQAVAEITKTASDGRLPLYYTDTIYGENSMPTHYMPLSVRQNRRRRRAYEANTSQVTALPPPELYDMHEVLRMTRRRGMEIGYDYASVLLQDEETALHGDPVADLLGDKVLVRNRREIVVFQR